MKLGYVILYVADVATTLDFYQRAFGLERKFLHESGLYGELATGETSLAFAADEMAGFNGFQVRPNRLTETPAGAEVALVSDDVAVAYATAIKAGAQALVEPNEKPWGQTVAYVRDLNGVLVEICSPI